MNAVSPHDAIGSDCGPVLISPACPEQSGSAWTSCRVRFARSTQGATPTIQDIPRGELVYLWSPGRPGEVTRQTCPDGAAALLCQRGDVFLDTSKANERRGKQ